MLVKNAYMTNKVRATGSSSSNPEGEVCHRSLSQTEVGQEEESEGVYGDNRNDTVSYCRGYSKEAKWRCQMVQRKQSEPKHARQGRIHVSFMT